MRNAYIEVVNPVADFEDVAKAVSRHAPRSGLTGRRVLLLPAEKSSSPPFIEVLLKRMAAQTTAENVFTQNPQWPFFHPARAAAIAPEIDAAARQCDLMISGVAY
jgi:hypothetical protein